MQDLNKITSDSMHLLVIPIQVIFVWVLDILYDLPKKAVAIIEGEKEIIIINIIFNIGTAFEKSICFYFLFDNYLYPL